MTYNHYMSEAGFLTAQLAGMVVQTLHHQGQLPLQKQDEKQAASQERPTEKDYTINWEKQNAFQIRATVNAANPNYGGAVSLFRNQPIQILQVSLIRKKTAAPIGEVTLAHPEKGMQVACKKGVLLRIDIVQTAEGIMTGARFVEMAQVKVGERFS